MHRFCKKRRTGTSMSLHLAFRSLALALLAPMAGAQYAQSLTVRDAAASLPDAPGTVYLAMIATPVGDDSDDLLPPCPPVPTPDAAPATSNAPLANTTDVAPPPAQPPACTNSRRPLRVVVDAEVYQPLTSKQKAHLAIRDVIDPFNLIVVGGEAGIGIAVNSHSAYGSGFRGFGKLAGYDLLQDAQGEFIGTYLIPSLAHEDPRYRRMQHASVPLRILHALAHTVIAQHDDGSNMPNYATLLTYPLSAELSNLYVPGVQGNGRSTARRIGIGLATDPAGNLIAEFLPDLARRIHVRSIFIQQIVNQMASGMPLGQP
jgi:hypothetical protein